MEFHFILLQTLAGIQLFLFFLNQLNRFLKHHGDDE